MVKQLYRHPFYVGWSFSARAAVPILGENVEPRLTVGQPISAVVTDHRVLAGALEVHAFFVKAKAVRVAPTPTRTSRWGKREQIRTRG